MSIKFREDKKPYQRPKPVFTFHKPETVGAKRGPKPTGNAKQLLTLRLDPDVIKAYRDTGQGWQRLMNTVLRRYLHL